MLKVRFLKIFRHYNPRLLRELRLGVLGMGAIGVEVAKAGLFFGMDVRGLARTEPRDPVPSRSSATRRL